MKQAKQQFTRSADAGDSGVPAMGAVMSAAALVPAVDLDTGRRVMVQRNKTVEIEVLPSFGEWGTLTTPSTLRRFSPGPAPTRLLRIDNPKMAWNGNVKKWRPFVIAICSRGGVEQIWVCVLNKRDAADTYLDGLPEASRKRIFKAVQKACHA